MGYFIRYDTALCFFYPNQFLGEVLSSQKLRNLMKKKTGAHLHRSTRRIECNSPVAPSDADRLISEYRFISGYRLTQTALYRDTA